MRRNWKNIRKMNNYIDLEKILTKTNSLQATYNYSNFNRARQYLKYFYEKHRFLILLGEMFSLYKYPCQYPFLSKLHKMLLVFICYEVYLGSIKRFLADLKK